MIATIYHNPRCSKSRQTLALLEEHGVKTRIIEYLDNPPSATELTDIVARLGIGVRELLRSGEDDFKAARAELASMDDGAVTAWLAQHPKVIQRPIVLTDKGARIGRPPESVLDIL